MRWNLGKFSIISFIDSSIRAKPTISTRSVSADDAVLPHSSKANNTIPSTIPRAKKAKTFLSSKNGFSTAGKV